MIQIDEMIKSSMLFKMSGRTEVYRALKNEFIKHSTAKNATELTEEIEIQIIQRMIKQRKDSEEQFRNAGREELACKEGLEIGILEELLPVAPTEEEITNFVKDVWGTVPKQSMGVVIREIKKQFPSADGKMISDIVKSFI